jgi:hypothetical protein
VLITHHAPEFHEPRCVEINGYHLNPNPDHITPTLHARLTALLHAAHRLHRTVSDTNCQW